MTSYDDPTNKDSTLNSYHLHLGDTQQVGLSGKRGFLGISELDLSLESVEHRLPTLLDQHYNMLANPSLTISK